MVCVGLEYESKIIRSSPQASFSKLTMLFEACSCDTYLLHRRATWNFSGQGMYRGIWAFWQRFRQKHKKRTLRREKFWKFFLLDTLKTTFWMENLTQRWIQPRPSFQYQGTFFDFQQRAGEASPLPTLVARLFNSYGRLHI